MRIGVEHRGRLEGFTGAGFADNREDLYWLNRFRVTARFSMKPWLSAAVQAQDARVEGRNGAITGAPFRDQFDLRLAHVDVGSVREEPVRAARRTAGARVRRSAARRTRQLAQHRALVRCRARRLPPQETARSMASPPRSSRFRWTTSIAAAAATTSTARTRRSRSCRMAECSSRIEFVRTARESDERKPAHSAT